MKKNYSILKVMDLWLKDIATLNKGKYNFGTKKMIESNEDYQILVMNEDNNNIGIYFDSKKNSNLFLSITMYPIDPYKLTYGYNIKYNGEIIYICKYYSTKGYLDVVYCDYEKIAFVNFMEILVNKYYDKLMDTVEYYDNKDYEKDTKFIIELTSEIEKEINKDEN